MELRINRVRISRARPVYRIELNITDLKNFMYLRVLCCVITFQSTCELSTHSCFKAKDAVNQSITHRFQRSQNGRMLVSNKKLWQLRTKFKIYEESNYEYDVLPMNWYLRKSGQFISFLLKTGSKFKLATTKLDMFFDFASLSCCSAIFLLLFTKWTNVLLLYWIDNFKMLAKSSVL